MNEVEALRKRILALEATVEKLLDVLERSATLSSADRTSIHAAARKARAEDEPEPVPDEAAPLLDAGSPYRGGGPGRQKLVPACTRCGRAIEQDDAELSLGAGRVCLGCYSRRL